MTLDYSLHLVRLRQLTNSLEAQLSDKQYTAARDTLSYIDVERRLIAAWLEAQK